MPIDDFGFEEMMEKGKLILLDTGALVFNLTNMVPLESIKDYYNSVHDRDALKRLKFSREDIQRVIEFNHTLAQLFRDEPSFHILGDSLREYSAAEGNVSRTISLICRREKLVRRYNQSVSELQNEMSNAVIDKGSLDPRCIRISNIYRDIINNPDLSETDKKLIAYSVACASCTDTVMVSNDRRLLTQAHILGRSVMPRRDFHIYTMLRSDRFNEADGRHFLKKESKKII